MIQDDEWGEPDDVRQTGCARPDSPLWMAEWAYYQAVLDTGLFRGPLEYHELSGRLEMDIRLRAIRALVDDLAAKFAGRINPGAWAARNAQGGRKVAKYTCHDCGDAVSRRKNMPADEDGNVRCGRCKYHWKKYGELRPAARFTSPDRVRASA